MWREKRNNAYLDDLDAAFAHYSAENYTVQDWNALTGYYGTAWKEISTAEEEELEGALKDGDFRLIRRSGFVQAELSTAMKKRSQYFLSAGAVLQAPFQGALYQVGHTGAHPVYRYGRPLLLGVAE